MAENVPCAVVTGAGQGIGRNITFHLAHAGFDIVLNDIVADPNVTDRGAYEVQQQVEAIGRRCVIVQGDISQRHDHVRILHAATSTFGGIDLLVNNAGIAPPVRQDVLETSEESYDLLMGVNARGPFFLTQAIATQMIRQVESGRQHKPVIVFVTSVSAVTSSPSRPEYCISKAALSMTARIFAHRLAEHNICVFEVRPGIIATEMTATVKEKYDRLIAEGLLPQARWGTPDDVGKAVAALVTGAFGYSTGQIINIDGGFSIPRL